MPPTPPPLLLPRLGRVVGVTAAKPPKLYSLGCRCRRSSSSSWFSSNAMAKQPRAATRAGSRSSGRRWWSDDLEEEEEDEDQFDDEEEEFEGAFGSPRGQVFDEPWFTKALRAYGYVLPVILVSMLVATGPQAFLMAMAIPLAQSAISFALRAFSSNTSFWGRRRRDDQEEYGDDDEYYSDYRSSGWESEEEEYSNNTTYSGENTSSSSSRYHHHHQQQQPQSRGKEDGPDSEPAAQSDDIDSPTTATSTSARTGFGGWDELDGGGDQYRGRWTPAADTAAASATNTAAGSAARRRPPATTTRGRRNRAAATAATRYRQTPLFMRLLVALFPFLGSWFRIML